ncbi:hypothetical protein [Pseudomonas sp. TWP3-2]|uniref:hypothetical protein n=1 Tax=Pseudomonas sp. TWP3-2 TaxID=2804574 RepID=UPI003CEDE148
MDDQINLGKNGDFTLDKRALTHILDGDFTQRVDRHPGRTQAIVSQVLSGGLHTYTALKNFLNKHPKIVSLDAFDSSFDKDWFYIRELQNGVLTVKIPQTLFSGRAANLTQQPESYYKSGYLWKTLFPKHFSSAEIINCIDQALNNIDIEHSGKETTPEQDYHIVGYALLDDPMTAIRVQIQLQGKKIRSAFPSWSQPWTGNNGKPFSHADSISFIISESTERASPTHYKQSKYYKESGPSYEELKKITPEFLLLKTAPKNNIPSDEWRSKRLQTLSKIAPSLDHYQLNLIKNYLCDHAISKSASFEQHMMYASGIPFSGNPMDYNASQISQNVYECFYILFEYDNIKKTNFFLDCMRHHFSTAVIHAGGIHLFELKRLHELLISCVKKHHNNDSIKLFLECLSFSPSRAATYHEFNLNTYVKKHDDTSMMIIGFPEFSLAIRPNILFDFIELNLGENYLIGFNKEQRAEFTKNIISSQFSHQHLNDSLSYFTGSDFCFFAEHFADLLNTENKTLAHDKALERIVRDYHRMLVIYRQRVVMEDPVAYNADRFDYEFMSPKFCETTIQQHKRQFILIMHDLFLQKTLEFSSASKMPKLEMLCKKLLEGLSKESVPLPNYIPDYLDSWMKNEKYRRKEDIDLSTFKI